MTSRYTVTNKICLAVLPLQIYTDDQSLEIYFQGLIMDLITDLSRFRSLEIIAYNTAKALQPDEEADSASIENLKLDYMVKGIARATKGQVNFNLQLIHVYQKRLVWAEKFIGHIDEIFKLQEDIVEKIAVSLQQFVDHDLLTTVRSKPITSLNAYECWLRGYQELKKGTLETDEAARDYFMQAIEIDPAYARAYTGMSLSFFNEWSCQLWNRWEVSQGGAFEWAQKALELDEWDHVSNAILGRIYLYNGEYEKAEHYMRKSLQINPNDAETIIIISVGLTYLGYIPEAVKMFERTRRLNPARSFSATGTFIYFEMGELDKALEMAKEFQDDNSWVDLPAFKAAAAFLKGDYDQLKDFWNQYLDDFSRKINGGKPASTAMALKWMMEVNPYRDKTRLKPFWDYMMEQNSIRFESGQSRKINSEQYKFILANGLWNISYASRSIQLTDLKGYHDLALLLENPWKSVHCTDLMGSQVVEKGTEVIDDKAKLEYQQRIMALQQEIEEAEQMSDHDKLAALQEEYEKLLDHLSQATGKGGKSRKVSGTIEKCRTAVTWRVRSAVKKIAEHHPELGKHLQNSIKTGMFCEYHPEQIIEWNTKL